MSAGLLPSLRASGLFATDPDLGLDIDEPASLKTFYELVLAVLRIIAAVVLSRGAQNKQTIEAVRDFLAEYRLLMVGILKRESKVVAYEKRVGEGDLEGVLGELGEVIVVLVAATGFMEVSFLFSNFSVLFRFRRAL